MIFILAYKKSVRWRDVIMEYSLSRLRSWRECWWLESSRLVLYSPQLKISDTKSPGCPLRLSPGSEGYGALAYLLGVVELTILRLTGWRAQWQSTLLEIGKSQVQPPLRPFFPLLQSVPIPVRWLGGC